MKFRMWPVPLTYAHYKYLRKQEHFCVFGLPWYLKIQLYFLQPIYRYLEKKDCEILVLQAKLEKSQKDTKRVHRYLIAAEKAGELSFNEALQLTGILVVEGNDPYSKCYSEEI